MAPNCSVLGLWKNCLACRQGVPCTYGYLAYACVAWLCNPSLLLETWSCSAPVEEVGLRPPRQLPGPVLFPSSQMGKCGLMWFGKVPKITEHDSDGNPGELGSAALQFHLPPPMTTIKEPWELVQATGA